MNNRELLAEVRRFFPHARCAGKWRTRFGLRGVGDLMVAPVIEGGWCALPLFDHRPACTTGATPAEALRALGFAERVPAWRLPMWLQLKMLRDGRNACPLQSTQRRRKGARLGRRKRMEASHANHP